MTINEIRQILKTKDYDFLKDNAHLGMKNIILLTLGGSHAYGTNIEGSDLDIRGCALNSKSEILLGNGFEQVSDKKTDTCIYSFNKLVPLLTNVNPNTIEMLGCKKEHYLYLSDVGQELLDNSSIFLSQKCVHTFGGYANQQLRRLDNKVARDITQTQQEKHILGSIKNAMYSLKEKYGLTDDEMFKLYVDASDKPNFESEIFADVKLSHHPLRDFKTLSEELNNIIRGYSQFGKRNEVAASHGKLAKHMMHLVRLYYMCFDILENEQIVTYRENEHDLLMSIRDGAFLDENDNPIPDFNELLNSLEKRLEYDKKNTNLPEKPDYDRIDDFVMSVNEKIVKNQ